MEDFLLSAGGQVEGSDFCYCEFSRFAAIIFWDWLLYGIVVEKLKCLAVPVSKVILKTDIKAAVSTGRNTSIRDDFFEKCTVKYMDAN